MSVKVVNRRPPPGGGGGLDQNSGIGEPLRV